MPSDTIPSVFLIVQQEEEPSLSNVIMRNESRVLTVENANYDAVTLNNDHRHINEQPTNPIDDGQNMQKLLFLCRRCHEIFQHFFSSSSQDRAAGHLAADWATCLLRKNSTFVLTC